MRSSEELDTRNAEEQPRWQQRQLPASDQPTPSHTGLIKLMFYIPLNTKEVILEMLFPANFLASTEKTKSKIKTNIKNTDTGYTKKPSLTQITQKPRLEARSRLLCTCAVHPVSTDQKFS